MIATIRMSIVNRPGFPVGPLVGLSGQGERTIRWMLEHPTLVAALTEALPPDSAGGTVELTLPIDMKDDLPPRQPNEEPATP